MLQPSLPRELRWEGGEGAARQVGLTPCRKKTGGNERILGDLPQWAIGVGRGLILSVVSFEPLVLQTEIYHWFLPFSFPPCTMGRKPNPFIFRQSRGVSKPCQRGCGSVEAQVLLSAAWLSLCVRCVAPALRHPLFPAGLPSVNQEHLLLATWSHEPQK